MTNQLGSEVSDEETTAAILSTFYVGDKRSWEECILEFNELMLLPYSGVLDLDLDFENKPAEYFIIADTYIMLADLVSLYNHLSGSKEKELSLQKATAVKNMFLESVEHFAEKYEWIYNPPSIGSAGKYTIGKQLRDEFSQHYGAYAEITYLIAKGDAMKFDEVNKMLLKEYLALGEYLLRKRVVENID